MSRRTGLLRRHRCWLAPLGAALASWAGITLIAAVQSSRSYSFATGAATLALFAAMLVAASFALRNACRTWRFWRTRRRDDRIQRRRQAAITEAWNNAQTLADALVSGKRLAPLTVPSLVLHPGEIAHLHVTATVSNGWSGPSVEPVCRVVCTNQRLCTRTHGDWRSCGYEDVVAVYPDLNRLTLTLDFLPAGRLTLAGPAVPVIAAYVTWNLSSHTLGQRVR